MSKAVLLLKNIYMDFRSIFWKRNKKIVLFGAWFGQKFADNSRYLFQYLSENKNVLGLEHVVWVTRNETVCNMLKAMGYEAYMMTSKESQYYHKLALYHIVCNAPFTTRLLDGDILGEYSYGAKKINLWHGVAVVKGLSYASNEYINKKRKSPIIYNLKEFIHFHSKLYRKLIHSPGGWGDCFYISSSNAETEKLKEYFQLPDNHYIKSGYARNCLCLKLTNEENEIIKIIKKYKNIIIYLPTFRTGENDFNFLNVSKELEGILKENNILWIQKGHSADKANDMEFYYNDNILNLSPKFDINVLLPHITALITDYSSAMADALYHEKPVLLYIPDYEQYVSGERGLIQEAEEIMTCCGKRYFEIESLKNAIIDLLENPESAKPNGYYKLRKKYWECDKGLSDIWNDIVNACIG